MKYVIASFSSLLIFALCPLAQHTYPVVSATLVGPVQNGVRIVDRIGKEPEGQNLKPMGFEVAGNDNTGLVQTVEKITEVAFKTSPSDETPMTMTSGSTLTFYAINGKELCTLEYKELGVKVKYLSGAWLCDANTRSPVLQSDFVPFRFKLRMVLDQGSRLSIRLAVKSDAKSEIIAPKARVVLYWVRAI